MRGIDLVEGIHVSQIQYMCATAYISLHTCTHVINKTLYLAKLESK